MCEDLLLLLEVLDLEFLLHQFVLLHVQVVGCFLLVLVQSIDLFN